MAYESSRSEVGHRYRAADAGERGGGPAAKPAARHRVLLVEDNRNLRVTTSRMLEHLGYEVTAVAGGAEAVTAFGAARPRPDLVFLDVVMPGMDGMATLRAIRGLAPSAKVIMCSGSPDDLDRAAREGHATAVLAKPYDVEALAATLRRVLGET
jgi:CheY-like chemotaxis protein